MKYVPKPHQVTGIKFALSRAQAALFLDMGLGKTSISLTVVEKLLDACEIRGVLIVAPLRVVQLVWRQEAAQWDHTKRLKFVTVRGAPTSREIITLEKTINTKPNEEALRALATPADIYLVNYELFPSLTEWMSEQKTLPFDMIIWDESSKMKAPTARRFKLFKPQIKRFSRAILLTGTPAPNNYIDLWSQIYLLDQGDRLTPFITHFKDRYFTRGRTFYDLEMREGADKLIEKRIGDLVLSMKSEDHLVMPPLTFNTVKVELPKKVKALYKKFEDDMFIALEKGEGIEALNAASLSMKCRQITSGAAYHDEQKWVAIHDAKLDALEEIIDGAQGSPIIVAYEFKHELARLLKRWPKAAQIKGGSREAEATVAKWNKGQIPLLFVHPASVGHGINLQYGGNIIVFTSGTWNLELYEQTYKRLYRQGQTKPVIVHQLVCPGTVDVAVLRSTKTKAKNQLALLLALRDKTDI